jgi:hypothetical protein
MKMTEGRAGMSEWLKLANVASLFLWIILFANSAVVGAEREKIQWHRYDSDIGMTILNEMMKYGNLEQTKNSFVSLQILYGKTCKQTEEIMLKKLIFFVTVWYFPSCMGKTLYWKLYPQHLIFSPSPQKLNVFLSPPLFHGMRHSAILKCKRKKDLNGLHHEITLLWSLIK